ncbi:MAG: phosphotransferase, partial [Bacteroidia bacterium]|nr:phosphotransferase [Bacteroidia bacterium]
MWDFYQFQMHELKAVHADPHPGNFIITPDYKLGIIDFGCVKVIPHDFYESYFRLLEKDFLTNEAKQAIVFKDLRFLDDNDTAREREIFKNVFLQMLELLGRPFRSEFFDFSDKAYFESLFAFGEETSKIKELRTSNKPRGVRDALY